MKKIIPLLAIIQTLIFNFQSSKAQAPQAISYQAVARDTSGNLIANESIAIRFSILDVSPTGTIVYRERHVTTTDELGLFNVNIGQGTVENGNFGTIAWSIGNKYLQIEIDISGGTSYTNISTQQMLSVPYALSSGNSWSLTGNSFSNPNFLGTTNGANLKFRTNNIDRLIISGVTGNVGIGTVNPATYLHVSGGYTGVVPMTDDVAIFENDDNAYLHILTPSNSESGLLFGIPGASARSGIYFNSTNVSEGLSFKTGSGMARMSITSTGNIGIGTTIPSAPLHISAGISGGTAATGVIGVIENDANSYLQFLSPIGNESGFLFGTPSGSTRSGITFNNSNVTDGLSFKTGGNSIKMVLTSAGRLGIGTSNPGEKLDVVGNANIENDIIVGSDIELTGELHRPSSGNANLAVVAYGHINDNGTISSGSGNFTSAWNSLIPGYEIRINGETDHSNYVVMVNQAWGGDEYSACLSNHINIYLKNGLGLDSPGFFSFVAYKP